MPALDGEFIALSIAFILLGTAGIILFSGPITPAGDSCYCPIPTPEPAAAQGTSSILLAFGILFLPIGLLKGGAPSLRKGAVQQRIELPGGKVYTPLPIVSAKLYSFGLLLIIVGVDIALIPGLLLYRDVVIIAFGSILTLFGILAAYKGSREAKRS